MACSSITRLPLALAGATASRTRRAMLGAALLLVVPVSPSAAQTATADPADVASPEAIVEAVYETVNRRPGENFDWDRLRTLFVPNATMIPSMEQTGGELRVLSVQEFIDWIDQNTVVGGPDDAGFAEEQIASRVERFGDVAQVFSTYHKRYWNETEILGRGINSIQLVRTDRRWWIVSMAWDEEVGAGPLPAKYLPDGGD
jgi:hypothetical protein